MRELLRVSHGEVRLHPLNDYLGHPYAQLGALLDRLAEEGVVAEIRPVTSPTLAADNRTLVLSRPR